MIPKDTPYIAELIWFILQALKIVEQLMMCSLKFFDLSQLGVMETI